MEAGSKKQRETLLYEKVAALVEQMIEQGVLHPGEKAPSVRTLSRQQRISMSTAFQAYYRLEIRGLLERAFPDAAEIGVEDRTGTGDHFQVTVASTSFDGLTLLEQHRRVNEALAAPLADGTIHELRIKTKGTA